MRHSAWNSWPQSFNLNISSWSQDGTEGAFVTSSVTSFALFSFAGSGGDGASNVERHIALSYVSLDRV
jgi:hypothetical protein